MVNFCNSTSYFTVNFRKSSAVILREVFWHPSCRKQTVKITDFFYSVVNSVNYDLNKSVTKHSNRDVHKVPYCITNTCFTHYSANTCKPSLHFCKLAVLCFMFPSFIYASFFQQLEKLKYITLIYIFNSLK